MRFDNSFIETDSSGNTAGLIKNLSIRNKLLLVTMAVSIFAILVASSAFIAYQWYAFREVTVARQADQAGLVAENVTAALIFDDSADAYEILHSLSVIKSITNAYLYDQENRFFAAWNRDESVAEQPACPQFSGYRFEDGYLICVKPVLMKHKQRVGTLVIRSNMVELESFLQNNILAVIGMMFLTFFLTLLLSSRLQKIISGPVNHLAEMMKQVTDKRDYTKRGEVRSRDELGRLTAYFNDMLIEVEKRDRLLSDNVADLQKSEQELKKLRNYLENVINSMPSVLVGINLDGLVTQWNFEAEKVSGISKEDAVNQPLEKLLPEFKAEMANIRDAIARRQVKTSTKVTEHRVGEMKYSDITIYPLIANGINGAVIRLDDVTERVRLENMMIQTEKMMSVGGLAAGMAHEINNPLGIMLQACQNILRRLSPELPVNERAAEECGTSLSTVREYCEKRNIVTMIDDIRDAGERAARIVSNMLQFSRGSEARFQKVKLSELIERTIELAANDYDLKKKYDFRHIEIVREYEDDLPDIAVIVTEIEQVVLNLLKNAAQAISEIDNPQHKPLFHIRIYKNDKYLRTEVQDNGPGMPDDVRKRVFEPFFTTKPPGLGTGLGLSVSYMIITNNHKGTLEVENLEAGGSLFILRLPLTEV